MSQSADMHTVVSASVSDMQCERVALLLVKPAEMLQCQREAVELNKDHISLLAADLTNVKAAASSRALALWTCTAACSTFACPTQPRT